VNDSYSADGRLTVPASCALYASVSQSHNLSVINVVVVVVVVVSLRLWYWKCPWSRRRNWKPRTLTVC